MRGVSTSHQVLRRRRLEGTRRRRAAESLHNPVHASLPKPLYLRAVPNPSQARAALHRPSQQLRRCCWSRQYWKCWGISRLQRSFCVLRYISGRRPSGGICYVCVLLAVLAKKHRCVGWMPPENPAGMSQLCFDQLDTY